MPKDRERRKRTGSRLLVTQKWPSARLCSLRPEDSGHQKNAWVNSPTPANGNAKGSAPIDEASDDKLVDGAFSGPDSKPIAIRSDHEHYLLGLFVVHVLGQGARFFGSLAPTF